MRKYVGFIVMGIAFVAMVSLLVMFNNHYNENEIVGDNKMLITEIEGAGRRTVIKVKENSKKNMFERSVDEEYDIIIPPVRVHPIELI